MGSDESAGPRKKPRSTAANRLKVAIAGAHRLKERQQKDGKLIDDLCWDLYEIEETLQRQVGTGRSKHKSISAKAPEGPQPTVQHHHIKETPDGGYVVTFGNEKQVPLTRALKEILAILAADEGTPTDELVAWKSFDALGEKLKAQLGREFDHHAISQLLLRLRKAFDATGNDRRLIQSDQKLGARLRLKRKSSAAGRADSE